MLTNFRRALIDIHQSMATTSRLVVHRVNYLKAHVDQGQGSPAQGMQASAEDSVVGVEDAAPKPFSVTGSQRLKAADLSKLPDTFSELDVRLRAIIASLNDDIQIVIGSVQIQDAKAMKRQADLTLQLTESRMRQTEVSARQSRWTVAPAVLAALYLPMTLVTGIFGMNIKEVTGGEGPNWWWVVVVWAVTMGVTVGSIGRYALMEWQWYRQGMHEPKVAVNPESTDSIPGAQDHGTMKPPDGEADDVRNLSITRRKHLWRKVPKKSQRDRATPTV